jgi:hypothetical protein
MLMRSSSILAAVLLVALVPACEVMPGSPYDPARCEGSSTGCDLDGDGVTVAQGDPDDHDPSVHPGAEEVCDGKDNDVDGQVDEGVPTFTWYPDADADKFGDGAQPRVACAPDGMVADSTDCDDSDAGISPAPEEVCDGIDNDCEGATQIRWLPENQYETSS